MKTSSSGAIPKSQRKSSRVEVCVAIMLVACVLLVAFWEIMSNRSARAFAPFELTAADMSDFEPQVPGWRVRSLEVNPDPVEPNILVHALRPEEDALEPVLIRLVHGYNMVDCMRIKGEHIELLRDRRDATQSDAAGITSYQLWRVTGPTGDASVWATTMLRAGDFAQTAVDTRDMAFPRIGIPDNPGWFPRGMSLSSFRHPLRSLRLFFRAKWNASRADWLTFLGLRQPAWASEDMLTLVSLHTGGPVKPEREPRIVAQVLRAHDGMYRALRRWRSADDVESGGR